MAETWMPEDPPPQLPPPVGKALRIVLPICGALLLLAVTCWQAWLCVSAAVWIGLLVRIMRDRRRFNALAIPALAALEDGRYASAASQFGALAQQYRAKTSLGPIAAYHQGFALIRAGQAAAAVGVLLGVHRRSGVAIELARAFAIGGDVEKATRWLDAARSHGRDGPGVLLIVEGLVLCRAGRFDDACRHFDDSWSRIEAQSPVRRMREAWLLRAFAIASTSTPRNAGATEPWLHLLRSTTPTSLSWLSAHWPALATFAEVNGL